MKAPETFDDEQLAKADAFLDGFTVRAISRGRGSLGLSVVCPLCPSTPIVIPSGASLAVLIDKAAGHAAAHEPGEGVTP